MQWIEITVTSKPESCDATAAIMNRFGQGGVVVEEWEDEVTGSRSSKIKIYLPNSRNLKLIRAQINTELANLRGVLSIKERRFKNEDWQESLKRDFKTVQIGKRFVIKPSWADYPPNNEGRIVIELDPGGAFGTGLHPTTRMCLTGWKIF